MGEVAGALVAGADGVESAAARGADAAVAEGTCAERTETAEEAVVVETAVARLVGAAWIGFAQDLVGSWEEGPRSVCLPCTGASEVAVAVAGGAEEAGTGTGLADESSYATCWTC